MATDGKEDENVHRSEAIGCSCPYLSRSGGEWIFPQQQPFKLSWRLSCLENEVSSSKWILNKVFLCHLKIKMSKMHFSFENSLRIISSLLFLLPWRHTSSNNDRHISSRDISRSINMADFVVVKAATRLAIFWQVFSVGRFQHFKCWFLWLNFNCVLFRTPLIALFLHWWTAIFYWISRVCVDRSMTERSET